VTFSARSSEYGLSGLEKTDFHAGSKYYGTRCTTKLELVGLANSCTGDYYSDTRVLDGFLALNGIQVILAMCVKAYRKLVQANNPISACFNCSFAQIFSKHIDIEVARCNRR